MPLTIKRMSDGHTIKLDGINPDHRVSEVKKELHVKLAPKFEHGCRLMFGGKVLKSIHRLKHYSKSNIFYENFVWLISFIFIEDIPDNGTVEMNDTKNWSSSSSSSDSDR